MPLYLEIILAILACLGVIAIIYMIISFRKMGIVAKKMDYLIEDLTFKSELLTPFIDSIVKIGNYLDLFEAVFQQKTESLVKYVSNNKESIYNITKDLKEVIKEK